MGEVRENPPSATRFHVRFEHIHPFQDGNGRIGRFLMLKQCIENDIDIVVVDDEQGDAYKAWLEVAQTQGDDRFLIYSRNAREGSTRRCGSAGSRAS